MRRGIGRKIFGAVLGVVLLVVGGYALGYAGPTGMSGGWEVSAINVAADQQGIVDDVLDSHPMTVSFVDGELTMVGPCNSQSSRFFRVGDRLLSVPGFKTSNLCHWDGYSDGQVADIDRVFHSPGLWLSVIQEDDDQILWVRGEVELVLTEIAGE